MKTALNKKLFLMGGLFYCGLAVEHSAHDQKVVGSIPDLSNARWKWCQSHALIPTPNSGSFYCDTSPYE